MHWKSLGKQRKQIGRKYNTVFIPITVWSIIQYQSNLEMKQLFLKSSEISNIFDWFFKLIEPT